MPESESKRRRVRKGTRSCWECRRRKIRCQYASEEDRICIGCHGRGSSCISQEYVDEQLPPQPDRRLAQRLGRLEELMERLVEKIAPEAAIPDDFRPSPSASADEANDIDVLEESIAGNAPVLSLLGPPSQSMPTPESDGSVVRPLVTKYDKTSRSLHALLPSQHDINIIVNSSAGALFVISLFHSAQDYLDDLTESPASLSIIPPATSHPTVLAKRLLQLTVCLQQLPPSFDEKQLWLRKSVEETTSEYVAMVANLVTSNDELIGSVEGLECLILQCFYQANAGNLRKAWLSIRRALSLAQLMGVDRNTTKSIRSCDPRSDPARRAPPQQVWFRIVFCDRYLSLLLGLPVATHDSSFALPEASLRDTPMEKLEKLHAIVSARIIDRNRAQANEAYALTQSIDCELEAAAKTMGSQWWIMPNMESYGTPHQMLNQMMHMMLQIHHNSLIILLHLPYMLRDPAEGRYEYSKKSCIQASREILKRFLIFRSLNNTAFSCRHVDYSCLMASMTLLLGHLGRRADESQEGIKQHENDQSLVQQVKAKMEEISVLNRDKLSRESADIIKQLLPILENSKPNCACDGNPEGQLHLSIPYLGTININTLTSQALDGGSHSSNAETTASHRLATPAFDNMTNPSLLFSVDPGSADPFHNVSGTSDQGIDLNGVSAGIPGFPEFTAEAGDWIFQGVDTTYFSLLNGGASWNP